MVAAAPLNVSDWSIDDFTEGLVDKLDNNLIPANAAQDCQNVISRTVGQLKIRNGQSKVNATKIGDYGIQGLYPYYTEAGVKKLIMVCHGVAYYWDTVTSAFVSFHSGLDVSADVNFVTCANSVMGFNGINWPFKWDGAAAAATVVAPIVDTGTGNDYVCNDATGVTALVVGTRFHFITTVTNTWNTTVNYNNTGVKGITKGAAVTPAGTIVAGAVVPLEYNGTAFAIVASTFVPKDGKNPVLHKEKVFLQVTSAPSELWFSDSYEPEVYPAVNTWPFKDGDGDQVACHIALLGDMIAMKKGSLHLLKGNSLEDFRADELDGRTGCVGHRAACVDGIKMYFVGKEGLYCFNGLKAINVSSTKIPNFWKNRVNHQYLSKAIVVAWDDLIWICLPEGTSAVNNMVLVFDPTGEKFWVWRGINAAALAVYDNGTQQRLYSGDSGLTGFIREQDVGSSDSGVAIEAYWVGQAFSDETPERFKRAKRIFMERYKHEEVYSDTSLSANAYAVTMAPVPASYVVGMEVYLRAGKANTGAATINCNALGAKAIQNQGAALAGAEIPLLGLVHMIYDGTAFQIQAPWVFQVALNNEDTYTALTLRRDDGLEAQYKFPASLKTKKKWRYMTPRLYRNSLGTCVIRGVMMKIKTKTNPKVKKPKL